MALLKILVVEDEAVVAMEIQERLTEMGYQVVGSAASAETALQQAGGLEPDVVLMDIRIKGPLDGIEVAEELRHRFDVPVIYLTAHADQATLERAKLTGPFGYLLKPYREQELRAAIEMAVSKHRAEAELRLQAMLDPLTGLHNRRFLDEALAREFHRARRAQSPLSVAMMDIDRFKSLNDTYGHEAGDQMIRKVADLVRGGLRKSDLICRYGGDEFLCLLPDTEAGDAAAKIEAVCGQIRGAIIVQGDAEVRLTASAGVAAAPDHADHPAELVRAADEALYRAKQSGRDRVCLAQTAPRAERPQAVDRLERSSDPL